MAAGYTHIIMEEKRSAEPNRQKQPPNAKPRVDWVALAKKSIATSPRAMEMLSRR